MGKLFPVLLATIQYSLGFYIFKQPEMAGAGPLLSCIIVMLSVFLLLWSLNYYPKSLRRLWKLGQSLVEYIIAVFLMEYIMGSFWFPLEITMIASLPKFARSIEEYLIQYEIECHSLCEFIRSDAMSVIMSYLLSTMLLIFSLHAIRVIDLRLLDKGLGVFISDIIHTARRYTDTVCRQLGLERQLERIRSRKGKNKRSSNRKLSYDKDTKQCFSGEGNDFYEHDHDFTLDERYFCNNPKSI